jgi:hypothetical protein
VDVDRLQKHNKMETSDPVRDFRYANASPEYRFGGVLFIEKEGFNQAILESGLLEKYDLALASTKGQSVIALRSLLDEMVTRNPDFKIFTMTDFDISGASIRTTLTGDNQRRYVFDNEIITIPVCVTWPQAQELHDRGLSEPVKIEKDEVTKRYLTLTRDYGLPYEAAFFLIDSMRRVEINAYTTPELLEVIESAISPHCKKVLPDREHLVGAWRDQKVAAELRSQQKALQDTFADQQPPYGLLDEIAVGMQADPSLSWDEALAKLLSK